MCKNLVKIKNPNFNRTAYGQQFGQLVTVNPNLIPRAEYIEVPCGKCSECRGRKINEYIQRAIIESLTSHVFFITLTYDNNHIPYIEFNNERFYYADYSDIQNMFKRFRDNNHIEGRDFRYLCVNEYGEKKHRPHFHILLFVARLEGDIETTPHILRDIIFKNLGQYFAKNIGTRKHPRYEKLFTYNRLIDRFGKERSNYFVKYVQNDDLYTMLDKEYTQTESNVKAIRYLTGYVNKPSKYEQKVDIFIEQYKDTDKQLYLKLRHLLKSQVRFSKGFGCGFEKGQKFYMEKISVRCSSNIHTYTEIVDSLPDTYEEFVDLYPSFNEEILEWRDRDFYQHFSSWKRCLNGMTADEYMYHCVYLKYFKQEFSERYNRYKKELQPTISNIFGFCSNNYLYTPSKVKTVEVVESRLYKYLRSMVEESIEKRLPCISFKLVGSRSYQPMCKYYKDRVTTFDDTYNLYKSLGVSNYEEWLGLFEKVVNNNALIEQGANIHKYYNDDEICDKDVKNLDRIDKAYEILFTNYK